MRSKFYQIKFSEKNSLHKLFEDFFFLRVIFYSDNRKHFMIDFSLNFFNMPSIFVNFLSNLQAGLYDLETTKLLESLRAKRVPNRAERNADFIR